MAQFAVHRNTDPASRAFAPLLLDVQSDLISELGTRVVIPLYHATAMKGHSLRTLTPVLEIEGTSLLMMTPLLAGVSLKSLGEQVADLSPRRDEIIAALDLLITGI